MIKRNKGTVIVTTLLLLLPMVVGVLLWNRLPEEVPIHWNTAGEIDGWSSRAVAVFAVPGFVLAIHWLCILATSLDPKTKDQTPKVLSLILWICPVISLAVEILSFSAALGANVRVEMIMTLLVGFLYVALGNYLPKCRKNYTIGIKVMWALESEANWNATHRFAGKLWVIGGIAVMLCAFLPSGAGIWVLLAASMLLAALPVGYSYLYYRRHGS